MKVFSRGREITTDASRVYCFNIFIFLHKTDHKTDFVSPFVIDLAHYNYRGDSRQVKWNHRTASTEIYLKVSGADYFYGFVCDFSCSSHSWWGKCHLLPNTVFSRKFQGEGHGKQGVPGSDRTVWVKRGRLPRCHVSGVSLPTLTGFRFDFNTF